MHNDIVTNLTEDQLTEATRVLRERRKRAERVKKALAIEKHSREGFIVCRAHNLSFGPIRIVKGVYSKGQAVLFGAHVSRLDQQPSTLPGIFSSLPLAKAFAKKFVSDSLEYEQRQLAFKKLEVDRQQKVVDDLKAHIPDFFALVDKMDPQLSTVL